jgi:hypothetical protein
MRGGFGEAPVEEGQTLFGRYRIESVLGKGGMGVVVAATDLRLEQRVAIKFLLPHALGHPDVVERFGREARAAVRIHSEHVARVIDVGVLDDGAPFMVMEHLEGRDLSSLVQSMGRLSIDDAIDFILQTCEAMAEAHRLGIVHRDMKPANLFLVEGRGVSSGIVKVLDFGISKTFGVEGSSAQGGMTQSVSLLGSPFYMSPEQMTSAREVDARTDIWALGVILYEFLVGVVPFKSDSLPELCMAIAQQRAPSLRVSRPEIPQGLEALVLKCLEKDRARRFASVKDLVVALGPFAPPRSHLSIERVMMLGSRSVESGRGSPGAGSAVAQVDSGAPPVRDLRVTSTAPGWGKTAGWRTRSRHLTLAALAGAAAIALAGAAFLGFGWPAQPRVVGSTALGASTEPPPAAPPVSVTAPVVPPPAPAPLEKASETASPLASTDRPESPVRPAAPRPQSPARPIRHPAGSAPPPKEGWEDER